MGLTRGVALALLLPGCGFTVQFEGKGVAVPLPDEGGTTTTSTLPDEDTAAYSTVTTGGGSYTTTSYTTGGYTGPSSTDPGEAPSCVTGTYQDLIGWVDVRDPSGGACSLSASCVNAVYQAVLANPCDYDIDLDLACPPNSGGWVEEWAWSDYNGSGRAGSLQYGCLSGPTTLTVPAHSFVLDTFEWSPALHRGDYTGTATVYTAFPLVLQTAPFIVR